MARKKPPRGKPELDDGYVRIANELLQALIDYDLTAAQMKIIAVIIRETYGYNRKSKNLSVSYLAKAVRRDERNTRRTLNDLIAKKVVSVFDAGSPRLSREIGVNKYYLEWGRPGKNDRSEGAKMTGGKNDRSEGAKMTALDRSKLPPKPRQYKDTIKDNKPTASGGRLYYGFSQDEIDRFGD